MRSLAAALLGLGLVLDVISMVLRIRRSQGKTSDSGIPFVSLLLYYINTEWLGQLFVMPTQGRELLLWAGVHLLCQYAVPTFHRCLLTKRL